MTDRLLLLVPWEPRVGEIWRALATRAAPSYFQTWGWIETWLASLPAAVAPTFAAVLTDGEPVAACFLGQPRRFHHRVVPSRTRFLNVTGVDRYDELTIEHNAILVAPDRRFELATLLDLLPDDWDELVMPALTRKAPPGDGLDRALPRHRIQIEREIASPYVDLAKVRAHDGGFLGLLHATTRAQIRRAQRGFGELTVEVAADLPHALDIYDQLVALHAQHWRARGQPGAFADPWFDGFHRRLIRARLPHGEIQLVRVRAHGTTVGCLYNLVAGGRVLFYQSGLAPQVDARLKAGYVCHAEAVRHNAALGHASYDFLGGDQEYKHHLATDEGHLVWARIARPLARFAIDDQLRRWAHQGSGLVARILIGNTGNPDAGRSLQPEQRMRPIRTLALVLALAATAAARPAHATPGALAPGDTTLSDVAERVVDGVVNVSSTKQVDFGPAAFDPFFTDPSSPFYLSPDERKQASLGSGVIVSAGGRVITNAHVIDGADHIEVKLADGTELSARLVGIDPRSDLAVLQLEGDLPPLHPLTLGNSARLRLGEVVLAVGNPFGVGQTVTMGIVSAKGRAQVGIEDYEDFIQTDAAINPGNSGGALVDMRGEVVGINTAILSRSGGYQGVGFAIPSDMARPIVEMLVKDGKVSRSWLGVAFTDLTRDLATAKHLTATRGVLVAKVVPDSPAARAGLAADDVIIAIDGAAVSNGGQLRNTIAMKRAGAVVLEIVRGAHTASITATLEAQPDPGAARAPAQPARSPAKPPMTPRRHR